MRNSDDRYVLPETGDWVVRILIYLCTSVAFLLLSLKASGQTSIQTHRWDFNEPVVNNTVEGWNIYRFTGASTSGGILNLVVENTYCNINYTVPAGTLDPAVSTQAVIRLKNSSGDKRGRFYWSTPAYPNAYIDFQLSANDHDFVEYTIDLSNDPRWVGIITNLRWDVPYFPKSIGSTLQIDDVMLKTADPLPDMPLLLPSPFGVNLAGAEFGEIGTDNYGYPHIADLDYFKSKGLTLFRLPFKWERIQPQLNGPLDINELAKMKNFVGAARARGLWILLDMHNYGRRKINGTTYKIGSPEVSIAHVADGWQKLAIEFEKYGNIWGYGIVNEPHSMLQSAPWVIIAQQIINSIREVDSKTTIVVGGESYSSAARWLSASDNLKTLVDPSDNLVFEAHIYMDNEASGLHDQTYDGEGTTPTTGITRAMPFIKWLKDNNKRGFIGEYGVPDNDARWLVALENLLKYLRDNSVNGTYWAAGPRWGSYTLSVQPDNGVDWPQMAVLEKYPYAGTGPLSASEDQALSFNGVTVYPNPSVGAFQVRVNTRHNGEITTAVFNASGALVQSHTELKSGGYQKTINLAGHSPGLYFVKVSVGSFAQSRKLVIL